MLIYVTLGVAPQWWEIINKSLAGNGIAVEYCLYASIAAAIFFYLVYIKKENSIAKYFWFFVCVGLSWAMLVGTPLAAEKIHVAEYGLLGVLLYNALKADLDCLGWKLYVAGALLCLVIGAVDELIQLFLANRYFGWKDLVMNGASGALALSLIRLSILKNKL